MKHLDQVKENYFKHLLEAILISLCLFIASLACLFHAIFPFVFKKTASTIMRKILTRTDKRYAK